MRQLASLFALFLFVELAARIFSPSPQELVWLTGAHPSLTVHHVTRKNFSGTPVPLAGRPHTTTLLCNEDHRPVYYNSDRFGFNNPDSAWDKKVELLLIGDSYVHGYCVQPEHHFVTELRKTHSILNLGLYGTGPLAQLGTFLEYGMQKKPKKIIWFLIANDLNFDMRLEKLHPTLLAYSRGEIQNLRTRASAINKNLERLAEQNFAFPLRMRFIDITLQTLIRWLRPATLRRADTLPLQVSPFEVSEVASLIQRASKISQTWGGELRVVFIPDSWQFMPEQKTTIDTIRFLLKEQFAKAKIDFSDFTDVIASEPNVFDSYSAMPGYYGHFNPTGQTKLASWLLAKIGR